MHKRTTLTLLAGAALAGCGFHLRGAPQFAFRSLYIQSEAAPALGRELARTLQGAGGDLQLLTDAAQRAQADAVLELLFERRERVVLGLSASGQVRELQLRLTTRFQLRGKKGQEWIAPTELQQHRDVSYNEAVALSKEAEEQMLFRNMQTDLVHQLLRRMAAAGATLR